MVRRVTHLTNDEGCVLDMSYEWRRLRRPVILSAAVAVAALALAGCMRMQVDATVTEDDTVNGTVILALADSVLELAGDEADGLWEESGFEGDEGVTSEDYAQDGFTGKKYTFADTPLSEFSDQDLSITREGDEFVVDGNLDMSDMGSEDLEGLPGMEGILDSFEITVAFTFPGEVVSSNGTVDGNTVTWEAQPGQPNPLEARAKASASSPLPLGLILGIVGAVVVVGAVVAVFLVTRRRRRGAPAGAAPVEGAPVEGAPTDLGSALGAGAEGESGAEGGPTKE